MTTLRPPGANPFTPAASAVRAAYDVEAQVLGEAMVNARRQISDELVKALETHATKISTGVASPATPLSVSNVARARGLRATDSSIAAENFTNRRLSNVEDLASRAGSDPTLKGRFQVEVLEPLEAQLKAAGFKDPKLEIAPLSRNGVNPGRWQVTFKTGMPDA